MAEQRHVVRTREEWQQLIEAQRSSGQSQDTFCAARGLCKSTLQAWKRRLYGRRGTALQPAEGSAPAALFTPLVRSRRGAEAPAANPPGWTVELELGGGLCLRLRQGA